MIKRPYISNVRDFHGARKGDGKNSLRSRQSFDIARSLRGVYKYRPKVFNRRRNNCRRASVVRVVHASSLKTTGKLKYTNVVHTGARFKRRWNLLFRAFQNTDSSNSSAFILLLIVVTTYTARAKTSLNFCVCQFSSRLNIFPAFVGVLRREPVNTYECNNHTAVRESVDTSY